MSIRLDNIRRTRERIHPSQSTKYLQKLGEQNVLPAILNAWSGGKNAAGKSLKKLSAGYKESKEMSGRNGIPDMNWTGNMTQSMMCKVYDKDAVIITASGSSELNKLRNNLLMRSNLLEVNQRIIKKISLLFQAYIGGSK